LRLRNARILLPASLLAAAAFHAAVPDAAQSHRFLILFRRSLRYFLRLVKYLADTDFLHLPMAAETEFFFV
jgi:hypothetical protein